MDVFDRLGNMYFDDESQYSLSDPVSVDSTLKFNVESAARDESSAPLEKVCNNTNIVTDAKVGPAANYVIGARVGSSIATIASIATKKSSKAIISAPITMTAANDILDGCKEISEDEYNLCCDVKMDINQSRGHLICMQCGSTKPYFENLVNLPEAGLIVSVQNRKGNQFGFSGHVYQCSSTNYAKCRSKFIYEKLVQNRSQSQYVFDDAILAEARDICITVLEKHTYRHNILNEILAASLRIVNQQRGNIYKDSVYASYMGLPNSAFPTGDKIMRDYYKMDATKAHCFNIQDPFIYIKHYFITLGIDSKYALFVNSLVKCCITYNISDRSILTTKCIGAIYALIVALKLDISVQKLEDAAHTKASTFRDFYDCLMHHKHIIRGIYKQHGIPL
jgi:hypothetical protein